MDILFFDIVNTKISLQNECKCLEIVGGNSDYECHFSFTDEWNGLIKNVVFYNNKSKVVMPVLLDTESCVIPYEVLTYGDIEVGVIGTNGEDVKKSTQVYKLSVGRNIKDNVDDERLPSSTIYEQVLVALANAEKDFSITTSGLIYFDRVQNLTDEQKRQVRENIAATSQELEEMIPLSNMEINRILNL